MLVCLIALCILDPVTSRRYTLESSPALVVVELLCVFVKFYIKVACKIARDGCLPHKNILSDTDGT